MSVKHFIRIVDVDFYMASPLNNLDIMYSEFRGSSINQVPVIRVFGSTQNGNKICVHVHGVFPYLYIPYDGEDDLNTLMYQIAASIDKALNISLKQATSNAQHVCKISLVSAYPFYGYHSKQHQFLKIYLYNPSLIRKLSNLLQNEAILGKVYQPHECHLSFILQFMIDYNLHGMSNMLLSDMKLRRTPGELVDLDNDLYLPPNVLRISNCELEADVLADNIINRLEVSTGNLAVNPGIAALWEDEKQRRRNKNEDSQIESCLSLKNTNVKPTNSHFVYKRALLDRLAILSTDNTDSEKNMNLSVYPAETPSNSSIQNASSVDIHSSLSSNSFSDSLLDATIAPSQNLEIMNNTLDNNFLEILQELDVEQDESLEEDSILSQVIEKNQEEDDLDLSMPLPPSTPIKFLVKEGDVNSGSEDDMWNDTLDTTVIPQLDGCHESNLMSKNSSLKKLPNTTELSTVNTNKVRPRRSLRIQDKTEIKMEECNSNTSKFNTDLNNNSNKKKTNFKCKSRNSNTHFNTNGSRNMPLLNDPEESGKYKSTTQKDNKVNIVINPDIISKRRKKKCSLKTKLKTIFTDVIQRKSSNSKDPVKLETKPRKPKLKVKKLTTKRLKKIRLMQYILKKENNFLLALKNGARPKFNVKPKINADKQRNETGNKKPNILSNILVKPALLPMNVEVKYPNDEYYLYSYSNNTIYPKVSKQDIGRSSTFNGHYPELTLQGTSNNLGNKGYLPCYIYSDLYLNKVEEDDIIKLMRKRFPQDLGPTVSFFNKKLINNFDKLKKEIYEYKTEEYDNKELSEELRDYLLVNGCNQISQFNKNDIKTAENHVNNKENVNTQKTNINEKPRSNNDLEVNNPPKKRGRPKKQEGDNTKKTLVSSEQNRRITRSMTKKLKITTRSNKLPCLCLDGAFDSSSSDEDVKVKKRKFTTTNAISPRYRVLPVSISSQEKGTTSAKNPRFSIDTIKKTTPAQQSQTKCSSKVLNITSVKRQLDFCDTLQTTVVEEKMLCNLKSEIHNSSNVVDTPSDDSSNSESESNINKSFFEKSLKNLTKAERYDLESNFVAIEGSSKLTPVNRTISESASSNYEFPENKDIIFPSSDSEPNIPLPASIKISTNFQSSSSDLFSNSGESAISNSQKSREENLLQKSVSYNNNNGVVNCLIEPKIKAPKRSTVLESLSSFNLMHVKNEEPYYSNVEDVTSGIEVGLSLLKVLSKSTIHLAEFDSKLDAINLIRKAHMKNVSSSMKWNRNSVNSIALSCVVGRDVILTPIIKPPSKASVSDWLLHACKKQITPKKKNEKVKIFIPLSPSADDDEMNMSLTLSPCSPVSSQSSVKLSETPKSSFEGASPTLGKAKTKKKIERSSQSKTVSLRKSLLLGQDKANNSCQLTGVSINNSYGFEKSVNNLQDARVVLEHQFLTVMVMELHVRTRGDLKPNPEYDVMCALFYSILNDIPETDKKPQKSKGVIAINSLPLASDVNLQPLLNGTSLECNITYVSSEEELITHFLELINFWDPDIFAGYEIEMLSWGYIVERASVIGINLAPLLGRIKEKNQKQTNEGPQGELKITGRILLDVWRLMRHEIALQSYTFESIIYHILHKRVPAYTFKSLTFWWDHRSNLYRHRTLNYYFFRVDNILELFDKLDLLGRTSELARLFGIQFYEVLSRGSQFRVESMMLRLAKPLNFIPVSPSVQQRAKMNAPEYIPLVLEPESKFYVDPVVVLDFQSLYPSMIIAYNYCFSTCVGKVERLGKNVPFEFGATQLKISKNRLEKLVKADLINFSPCGVGFVKSKVREGILPRMLKEILGTRLMVKNSMKENKDNRVLQKVLHSRQLGLKLIANVTYGYTAANFSGRMPSVEVGDSVVSKGRETLQRAIAMVDNTPEWGAKVVYGDTDSLFILFPGRSKDYAFEVGKKIADVITNDNPDPVKLKFEKVYQPCILQTKKRYVGYMYETPDQKDPVYEAKGIETVRRDGCPAVTKILEKCLRLLFETKDVSAIKNYVLRQFYKIIAGRISIQDLTFAKEYRGASGYRPGACVPSLELARKWTAVDKRNEPRSGERVPYVIVNGPPGLPLIKLVRSPRDLIADSSLRPNSLYYITRVIIPPVNRCLTLIGADLNTWFNQMPRKHIQFLPTSSPGKKSTISQYFFTSSCASCGEQTKNGVCTECCCKPQTTVITLSEKIRKWEQSNYEINLICQTCTGCSFDEISCTSLDCSVYYRRIQTNRDVQQTTFVRQLLSNEF